MYHSAWHACACCADYVTLTALPGCSGCAAELKHASPADAMCNSAVQNCTQGGRLHSFKCNVFTCRGVVL